MTGLPGPGPETSVSGEPTLPDPETSVSGPDPVTFLSGEHGEVGGRRAALRRAADRALDAWVSASGTLRRIDELPGPRRDVLVVSVYRPPADTLVAALPRLRSRRHRMKHAFGSMGSTVEELARETVAQGMSGGKFENLNELVAGRTPDWLVVVDDDIVPPPRLVDRLIALAELFDLALVQPAQSLASHAAWRVSRRRPGSLVRETRFVEIGPVTAFRRDALEVLLPFPPLTYGWGLDLAWAAVADARGWRVGVADALAVRHEQAPVAAGYPASEAISEAQRFLSERPYLSSAAAQETLVTHRRLP